MPPSFTLLVSILLLFGGVLAFLWLLLRGRVFNPAATY